MHIKIPYLIFKVLNQSSSHRESPVATTCACLVNTSFPLANGEQNYVPRYGTSFYSEYGEKLSSVRRTMPYNKPCFPERSIKCLKSRTPKFTLREWKINSDRQHRDTEDQQQLADKVLLESERIREETKERAEILKATSDRRIEERIIDVEFVKKELQIQRKGICLELESLSVYKSRLDDCIANLQENALNICRKCLIIRDGRVGIDLVMDPVEKALQDEITSILGAQSLLKQALDQLNEQVRRLKATRYMLDRDLEYKQKAIDLDKGSLTLKPTDLCLSVYKQNKFLDPATISTTEYSKFSTENIKMTAREIANARPIKVYIDTLLQQVFDDLWTAYKKCNQEFKERIKQTKAAKEDLENMYRETTEKIITMQKNITSLRKAIVDKEGVTALAHTRFGRRSQRIGSELVLDDAGQALFFECEMLRHSTEQLQKMLNEANTSLRYLLQTQLTLEEDINVKMNSLKIDEVDCMTLRQTMTYFRY